MTDRKKSFATRAVQVGEVDPRTGAHITPLYQTSTFAYGSFDRGERLFAGDEDGYVYSRIGNPTTRTFELAIADLEGAEDAVAFSSGMAAVSALAITLLEPGSQVLLLGPLYGGTEGLYLDILSRFGVEVRMIDEDELPSALAERPALLYLETPTNPTLKVRDLREISSIAKEYGVLTVVDNTFCTPFITRPLEFGADVVLHSATKYLGGHGDAVGGVACGSAELMHQVRMEGLRHLGGVLGPLEAYLFIRGLKTLPLRMKRHCDNAMQVARSLQNDPAIATVYYPGLPEDPGHEVAKRQMNGFGGMVSIDLRGGREAARAFLDELELFTQAVSLGDVASLATHPGTTTHQLLGADLLERHGVKPGLVRLSIGIEDPDDLLDDLERALSKTAVAIG